MNVVSFIRQRLGPTITRWCLVLFFAAQVYLAIPFLQASIQPLQAAPDISFVEKMHIQWGAIFDLLDFVRRETPETAVILMKDDGRPEFDQYFLFPRRVVYGGADVLQENSQIDYVLVDDGYPQFPVIGSKMMLDETHGLYKVQR